MIKWERLNVQITVEQAEKLRKLAFDQNVSQAQIVRDALDCYGQMEFKIDSTMLAGDDDAKRE